MKPASNMCARAAMARYLLELDTLLQCLAMLLTCVVTGIARAGIGARQLH